MQIETEIRQFTIKSVEELYQQNVANEQVLINVTPPEFTGDFSVVVFPFLKFSKKSPENTATEIGEFLKAKMNYIESFNVIKGFLNLAISENYWKDFLRNSWQAESYGKQPSTGKTVVVEYCGPNTNKPLHLGHIRNMLLGYSVAEILQFNGNKVAKVNIYNDRGIAICKSMVAWMKNGKGETPQSTGMKGDHFVGKYYVEYDKIFKKEKEELIAKGFTEEKAEKEAPIYIVAQETLRKWEADDKETLELWKRMNDWVYEGFNETYKKIGVDFEKNYYESETYLLGKNLVFEGLDKGAFYKKEDGSVWVNLTDKGLDEKVLLRSDGTSVYLTQDLGTAQLRYDDYKMDRSVYVVANEQDYHFKVLKLTLEKLEKPYAAGIYHLSYGMVDLPSGKMKSREGTVVDADELFDEMLQTAEKHTKESGKIEDFSTEEAQELYRKIGLGALKFFILRVDCKKRMMFDPNESIELHGQTGPFVQYSYARIRSVLRKVGDFNTQFDTAYPVNELEKELLLQLHRFPIAVKEAGELLDPSVMANYAYQLAKTYNKFYAEHSILSAENENAKNFRLMLSSFVADVIKTAFKLLGIEVPEKM